MGLIELGTVVRWVGGRAFGFIEPDDGGADAFVHLRDCPAGAPEVGTRVRYVPMATDRGLRATAVEVLDEHGARR